MATQKKGVLTSSKQWRRHLRPYGKRCFWKRERKAKDAPDQEGGEERMHYNDDGLVDWE